MMRGVVSGLPLSIPDTKELFPLRVLYTISTFISIIILEEKRLSMLIVYFFIGLLVLAAIIYLVKKIDNEKKTKSLNEDADDRQEKI